MKRVILLFAAVLLASIGWSQTMVVTLNDGTTVKYDMGIVKSIEFTDEDSGSGQETSTSWLVGTWRKDNHTGNGQNKDRKEFTQFKSNGTYINVKDWEDGIYINYGIWTLTDSEIILTPKDSPIADFPLHYQIIEKGENILVLSFWETTINLVKVSDSEIEKYL